MEFFFSRPVCFIYVTCAALKKNSPTNELMDNPKNFFVSTPSLENIRASLSPNDFAGSHLVQKNHYKYFTLKELGICKPHYLSLHNRCRCELITSLDQEKTPDFKGNWWLIKRIVVGRLTEASTNRLVSEKILLLNEKKLTPEDLNSFSRIVLAMRLPKLRPELYLRLRNKAVYFKMGPINTSTFKFERNIRSERTAFFLWLDHTELEIPPDLMDKIMKKHLTESVVGSRKKHGESPERWEL